MIIVSTLTTQYPSIAMSLVVDEYLLELWKEAQKPSSHESASVLSSRLQVSVLVGGVVLAKVSSFRASCVLIAAKLVC